MEGNWEETVTPVRNDPSSFANKYQVQETCHRRLTLLSPLQLEKLQLSLRRLFTHPTDFVLLQRKKKWVFGT